MSFSSYFYFFVLFVALLSTSHSQIRESPFLLKDAVKHFDQKLFSKLASDEKGNIVYSPFSLHMLLSQAYVGSPTASETSKELANLLSLKTEHNEEYLYNYLRAIQNLESKSGLVQVNIANSIFAADDLQIKSDFTAAMDTFYKSDVHRVTFKNKKETADTINKFVSDKTKGLIEKIITEDAFDALSRLVMVNAIYFKGQWRKTFLAGKTATEKFHVDATRETDYDAMHLNDILVYADLNDIEVEVLKIPYVDDKLSMIIALPHKDANILTVESKLATNNPIFDKIQEFSASPTEVDLTLPKFEISYEAQNLEQDLKNLGVATLFDVKLSDLSDIANETLYVTKVVHKAVLKVNEEGSEAAAASGVVIATRITSTLKSKVTFVVDRPFLFYIFDHSENVPLFAGRIVDPNGKMKL